MCQLICKPEHVILTKATLQRAWNENPHGAGFSFLKDNTVFFHKGFFKFKEFWKAYQSEAAIVPALIHFRYATHGEHSAENCHPFVVGTNLTAGHNGILSRFLPSDKDNRSDSRLFFEDYLAPVMKHANHPAETLEQIRPLIQQVIGSSKIAILGLHGFTIYNEGLGEWHEGAWYSAGYPTAYPVIAFARGGYGKTRSYDYSEYYQGYGYREDEEEYSYWQNYEASLRETELCAYCNREQEMLCYLGTERLCEKCYEMLSM